MARNKLFLKGMRKFDIFAQPFQLLVDQNEYHQTLFGSLLTLGLILLFANLLYTKLIVLFDRNNPTSLSSEVYHAQPELYHLFPQNFTMTFAFQNSTFNTYINDSIYVVRAYMIHKHQILTEGVKQDLWDRVELPLIHCSTDIIKQEELSKYFSHLNLPTNYCIDWNQISSIPIQGTFDASNFQYIEIVFNTCNERTKKQSECLDPDEIKKQLASNYFSFQISSQTTDLKSSKSPYQPKGQDLYTTISNQIYKEISVYLEPLTTITDYGLVQTDLEYERTLRYGRHTEIIDLSSSDLIMNVVIRLDTTEYVDYRSYPKIQEILAELGGLWQVLFSLFYIISKPINRISRYLQIINSMGEFTQNPNAETNDQISFKPEIDISPHQKQIFKGDKSLTKNHEIVPHEILQKKQPRKTIINLYADYIKKKFRKNDKKFNFGYLDAFKELQCIATSDQSDYTLRKFRQAQESIMQQINIVEILKKLNDVDKLKQILLTENQRIIFDNLKTIPRKIENSGDNKTYKGQTSPQDAVIQIIQDQKNEINCKLIQSLDGTICNLLHKKVKEDKKEDQQFE